jgi:hypothetical protein
MLLKGSRFHTFSITTFTIFRLAIHRVYWRALLPTRFHVYRLQHIFVFTLQGTWSRPCCWVSRIQLRLVGFIDNHQRLLLLCENAWLHVADYNDYSSDSISTSWVHQQPSATTGCPCCTVAHCTFISFSGWEFYSTTLLFVGTIYVRAWLWLAMRNWEP